MGFRLSHFVEIYSGKKIKAAAAATEVWAAFPSTKDHLLTMGHFSYPMQSPDSNEGLVNLEYGDGQIFALLKTSFRGGLPTIAPFNMTLTHMPLTVPQNAFNTAVQVTSTPWETVCQTTRLKDNAIVAVARGTYYYFCSVSHYIYIFSMFKFVALFFYFFINTSPTPEYGCSDLQVLGLPVYIRQQDECDPRPSRLDGSYSNLRLVYGPNSTQDQDPQFGSICAH